MFESSSLPVQIAPGMVPDIRLISELNGRYSVTGRRRLGAKHSVFACRAMSISPYRAVLSGPVLAHTGDTVTAYFEELGLVTGKVARRVENGFEISIEASEQQRVTYAMRLEWLRQRRLQKLPDNRSHKRVPPRQPHSTLIIGDGRRMRCFVIDMSASGAAVSADVLYPKLGTPVAVGTVLGRVVRHLDAGFAMQFLQVQDLPTLEQRLIKAFGTED